MTQITLPWPPSLNNLYFNASRGGRVKSKRYAAWSTEAWAILRQQRPEAVQGPFRLTIIAERPDNRRRDLDGLLKAPLDLLVACGIVQDDSLAQQLTIGWSPNAPAKPGCVRITLEAVDDPAISLAVAA